MIKKIVLLLLLCSVVFSSSCFAQDPLINFKIKQGMLYLLEDRQVKNFSCVEVIKTVKQEAWPNWANMLWEGWSIDIGMDYDNAGIHSGAVMLGRNLGTLGDYLPLDYPLMEKISVTLYPIGIAAENPFDHPEIQPALGASMIVFGVTF